MASPSLTRQIVYAGSVVGALVAIWGGISAARPLLESDGAPLSSIERVAALKSETVKTFGQIQSQSRTDEQATSTALCTLFSKLAANADAQRAKTPSSPQAIQDATSYDAQRDLWCKKMLGK